ncbi:SDR family oxidoreductase [Pseudomonas sp. BN417]|uniref:SDR family oxidoreductase n=1 Tax=Pseudomonas sp. BN417 TaxID=2567890 RepID=UPI0024549D4A|nr:SDR family oxidoreductase [Pseudomonas sp. BN417]MDH4553685.1 SDR family oxidoreductase [Pseudomonas sp. BN417]
MDLQLENRSALVCGGSSGLGFGVAEALAREGVRVCLLARNLSKLDLAVERIRREGGEAQAVAVDLSDLGAVDMVIEQVVAAIGAPDILVANNGGPPPINAVDFDPQLWHRQLDAMLLGTMALTNAFLPGMRQRRFGRILMISSTSVVEPIPGLVLSSALRAALANWAKTLSAEVAADGVTVNTLMPGSFWTERTETLTLRAAERSGTPVASLMAKEQAAIPVGRYGATEEFGAVAAFLASPLASYVTGALIPVDGGVLKG